VTVAQVDAQGRLRHFLTLEGLPRTVLVRLLDLAQNFDDRRGDLSLRSTLAGKTVCTLFFEPSTRTRSSFQIAAQRLGADVLNFDASTSSTSKGETARDTMKNLEAMGVHGFVVRHREDGAVAALAGEARPAPRWSMPAMAASRIPPRACSTCSRCARPRAPTSRN
jgi:aspartate carbamoyltransferase catalytic subunit